MIQLARLERFFEAGKDDQKLGYCALELQCWLFSYM